MLTKSNPGNLTYRSHAIELIDESREGRCGQSIAVIIGGLQRGNILRYGSGDSERLK